MKVRAVIAAALLVLTLSSCSNDVQVKRKEGTVLCEQTNKNKFIGITLSTDRSLRNCGENEG